MNFKNLDRDLSATGGCPGPINNIKALKHDADLTFAVNTPCSVREVMVQRSRPIKGPYTTLTDAVFHDAVFHDASFEQRHQNADRRQDCSTTRVLTTECLKRRPATGTFLGTFASSPSQWEVSVSSRW